MSTLAGPAFQLPGGMRPGLDRLLIEHAGVLAAGTVIRCLARCHHELHRAGVRAGLPAAAEAMAGTRLRAVAATNEKAEAPDRAVR